MHDAATAVRTALDGLTDWGTAGTRPGQYKSDLAADEAAIAVLDAAGLGVMSEESGVHHGDREVVVVLDPVDGSTNASRCAALVRHQPVRRRSATAPGPRWSSTRPTGCGSRPPAAAAPASTAGRWRRPAAPRWARRWSACPGYPPRLVRLEAVPRARRHRPRPVRGGRRAASTPTSTAARAPTARGTTSAACSCAGRPASLVVDAYDRELVTTDHAARRTPVAAATPELLEQAVAARRGFVDEEPWAGSAHS